jgi:hypothetical protein
MEFNTYVVNLENDNDRYVNSVKSLSDVNINPIRFNAIYGKDVKNEYNEHINLLWKPFIPKSCLGCALSHAVLSKQILETDDNDIALILEDDVVPLFKNVQDIFKVIENAPKDWDVILLFCQGMCNYKSDDYITGIYPGSTAAYLINRKGMYKQSTYKYSSHVDIQRKNLGLNVYKSPSPLFKVNETFVSHNKKSSIFDSFDKILDVNFSISDNISLIELSNYKVIRIPITGIELTWKEYVLLSLLISVIVSITTRKHKLFAFIVTFIVLISIIFMINVNIIRI